MTVLFNVPPQSRSGVVTTPATAIASDAAGIVRLILNIPTADYIDPLNALALRLEQFDAGVWREIAGRDWRGGAYVDRELGSNPAPYVALPIALYRGRQLRAVLTLERAFSVGATIDLEPNWPGT